MGWCGSEYHSYLGWIPGRGRNWFRRETENRDFRGDLIVPDLGEVKDLPGVPRTNRGRDGPEIHSL